MGYVGWINSFEGHPNDPRARVYESEMVHELRACGAIFYVKTAVPHTLMVGETINNIIGYVSNPKNRLLSSGGSSGGEGALIALRGSPVGFGTDIGGSIRIPAAFNGLYGLRPSVGRLPYEGMANSMEGQNSILSVVGPLGTSIGALRLVVKSVLVRQPWLHDPLVHEIPWRSEQEQAVLDLVKSASEGKGGHLVFGILRDDGIVRPVPPVRRAMDIVVKTIEKLGHKVIEWNPPSHKRGVDIGVCAHPALLSPFPPHCSSPNAPSCKPGSSTAAPTSTPRSPSPASPSLRSCSAPSAPRPRLSTTHPRSQP
jgi:amidase